jgi:hypothetical protein
MIANLGVAGAVSRVKAPIPQTRTNPVTPLTSGGQEVVYRPPTISKPASGVSAVDQALSTSKQLTTNTITGAGTGAGRISLPFTVKLPGSGSYVWLAFLGAVLLIAFAVDRGKL